jgi:hypothetical protein
MPVRKRNINRRANLDQYDLAWLNGDRQGAGLSGFMSDEKQQVLWDQYGDKERFHWQPGMWVPEPL